MCTYKAERETRRDGTEEGEKEETCAVEAEAEEAPTQVIIEVRGVLDALAARSTLTKATCRCCTPSMS